MVEKREALGPGICVCLRVLRFLKQLEASNDVTRPMRDKAGVREDGARKASRGMTPKEVMINESQSPYRSANVRMLKRVQWQA
jgi:hypothetical protein